MTQDLPEEPKDAAPNAESTSDEVAFWALERLRSDLDELKSGLGSLVEVVSGLEEQVATEDQEEPKGPQPVAWSWHHMTGESRRDLWEHLIEFVGWINDRYFRDQPGEAIAACWFEHGLVVEELTGMWAAWHAALHNAKSPNTDYAAWHRYYFWPAMERINHATKDCRMSKGHERVERRPFEQHPRLDQFMADDCAAHTRESTAEEEAVDRETGEIRPE